MLKIANMVTNMVIGVMCYLSTLAFPLRSRMSFQCKKAIVNKISQTLLQGIRNDRSKFQIAEKKIAQVIKVQKVGKEFLGVPQFSLKVSDLSSVVDGNIQLPEDLTTEHFTSHTSDGVVYFNVNSNTFLKDVVSSIRSQKANYGYLDTDGFKYHICVEFSSPNIAKPFHVGHLRSTIIGHILSNMYEAAGHDVKRVNFLGDWGTQFGLLSLGLERFSTEELWRTDPLYEFVKAYVEINKQVKKECDSKPKSKSPTYQEGLALFAQLEKGDPELRYLWSEVRKVSMVELDKMYKHLGVTFTHYMPESQYQKTDEILQFLKDANMLRFDENGVGYVETENGRVSVVKSDGSSLYMTRDIGAALDRRKRFSIDKMHYVVENGQQAHFANLVNICKQLGMAWANRPLNEVHVRFGRVKGMSTRSGNVVFLRELLDEASEKISKSMEERETTQVTTDLQAVAERLAVTAVILQDLKADRTRDYDFSWDRALSFKSDSGIFAQYCHARICSMLRNCGVNVVDEIDIESLKDDTSLHKLVLHMARYPDVFNQSLATLEPHHIVQYLFKLCHLVNGAYSVCPVIGETQDLAQARLLVFESARQVLYNCLKLLGSQPLTKM